MSYNSASNRKKWTTSLRRVARNAENPGRAVSSYNHDEPVANTLLFKQGRRIASNAAPPMMPRFFWMDEAVCSGMDNEIFFSKSDSAVESAKSVCRGCPAIQHCLAHALSDPALDGVWGGTSKAERDVLRSTPTASLPTIDHQHKEN